ncbi:MAG: PorP/SprF family type IX secretion system membrane protein [Saprospiraceae bacterium]|nr:PorP/SprF family type IX secretion system membrane protein [Saprospiraceae bacterium]
MKKIVILSLVMSVVTGSCLYGQDIHFSQFYMSPLNLNPALTGVMNCNQRFVANYRNQWASVLGPSAFNTYSASYDRKIAVGQYDYFGVGGTLWGDVAGDADFQTLQARLSGSYSRRMGGDRDMSHYLVFGADAGISQRSIDFLKLQFGSQHDGNGGFDPSAPSGENLARDNFVFADVSAGLLWFTVLNKNNNFYAGAAMHHINSPDVSFKQDSVVSLFTRYTFHAGGEFALGSTGLGLVPGVVAFSQGPSFLLNLGTSLRFTLAQDQFSSNTFQVGAWLRMVNNYLPGSGDTSGSSSSMGADAVILSTRFEYQNFGIGFSYDWNVSDLRVASNGNGAFEFSLVYLICGNENRGVYCPHF